MIKNILCSSVAFCYQTNLVPNKREEPGNEVVIKRVSSDVGKVKDSSVRAVQLEYYIYL